jgi:phospholipid/cholesterol/gamma-HCH transport system substrate-binding protein
MPSAQRVQWAKVRVSSLTIAALLILGTIAFLLTGGTVLEPKSTAYLYMPDAVGLTTASPVRVDGIYVGKVQSVALSGMNQPDRVVRITMTIERDRLSSIPDDSTAEASADNLVGDKFVDVTSGHSSTPIKPGGEIAYKASVDMMKRLDVVQFENQLRMMDALLTEIEGGQTPLGQFVQGDQMYRSVLKRLTELQSGIRAATQTTGQIGQALYTDTMYRQVAEPIHALDQSLAIIQSGQGPIGQLLRDDAQYVQLRDSIAGLGKVAQQFRAGPLLASDQQHKDWNRMVEQMIQMVDDFAANPMMTGTSTYENLAGMAQELQSAVKDFREHPKKYLRMKFF